MQSTLRCMDTRGPGRSLAGCGVSGFWERGWVSSRDHRGRQWLSRAWKRLEVDYEFLMCGLREDRNNVYRAKQMATGRSGTVVCANCRSSARVPEPLQA